MYGGFNGFMFIMMVIRDYFKCFSFVFFFLCGIRVRFVFFEFRYGYVFVLSNEM